MMSPAASKRVVETLPKRPGSVHLTESIAAGDERAFASFYEIWFDRALALASKATRRDESFCLDVVQDCMLRVVKGMRPLATEVAVEAWMARTVLTTAIDRLRSDRRRAQRERHAARSEHDYTGPATDAEIGERNAWLIERLREMPDRDQRLVTARFGDDKTLAEVGEALGMTGHAAHGRIRRIIARLRETAQELFQ